MVSTNLCVALLRQTGKNSHCQIGELVTSVRIGRASIEEVLRDLHEKGLVTLAGEVVIVSPEQRMRIAAAAVGQGSDPETISRHLRWQEFELLAGRVLAQSGYATKTHFVFKRDGRRFEMDVLGGKDPLLLCIDCKHWQYGWAPSRVSAAAKNQLLRVTSLSQTFRRYESILGTSQWKSVRMLPMLLTLADVSSRVVDGVPTVSALRFGTFLSEIGPWVEKLRFVDAR